MDQGFSLESVTNATLMMTQADEVSDCSELRRLQGPRHVQSIFAGASSQQIALMPFGFKIRFN